MNDSRTTEQRSADPKVRVRLKLVAPTDKRDWEVYVPVSVHGVEHSAVLEYWDGEYWSAVEVTNE